MDTIHVTENALKNIRALQQNMDAQGYGLRFGYTDGGCSGNKYIIEFEDAPEDDDMVFLENCKTHPYHASCLREYLQK